MQSYQIHICSTWFQVFKNWSSMKKRKYSLYASSVSLAQPRGSVSTEVTVLDQDLTFSTNEINENKVNEYKERRKCSY